MLKHALQKEGGDIWSSWSFNSSVTEWIQEQEISQALEMSNGENLQCCTLYFQQTFGKSYHLKPLFVTLDEVVKWFLPIWPLSHKGGNTYQNIPFDLLVILGIQTHQIHVLFVHIQNNVYYNKDFDTLM